MKNLLTAILLTASVVAFAQPAGYYNGTEGKTGTELKSALNDIISGHMEWAYFFADNVFIDSDADPSTPGNVITVYKGSSVDGTNYGTGGDFLNREHVWAKSHGQFDIVLPTGGDLHNLKPADGSVNVARSNKDFDNCQATGTQHDEATGCYYTADAWEPRDEVKGDIARIIFYMATRYEGENGEVDLEVNDQVNNSPNPFHGRLSALLQWNEQDPPDVFERNRNDVIYSYQQNRNPFIDNPEWVGMIWESDPANSISIGGVAQSQEIVFTGEAIGIEATITGTGTISATLNWGNDYTNLSNSIVMNGDGDVFNAEIPSQATETDVYFAITANDDNGSYSSVVYQYHVESIFNGTIIPIAQAQGEQAATPYEGQEVTISGVVTGNFGDGFFVQDGYGAWNGIFVYDVLNPQIGDSIILTGTVTEYYDLTEIVDVTDYYLISRNNPIPDPVLLTIDQVSEEHEGVLIKLAGVQCTDVDLGYGMWEVTDATGSMAVHNTQVHEIEPGYGVIYDVMGPCKWDYGEWKIELRKEGDVLSGDHTAPTVTEVSAVNATSIKVIFSEIPEEATSTNTANYSISNGVNISSAAMSFPLTNIILYVDEMAEGTYDLTIENVEDGAGNVMAPQTISFSYGVGIKETSDFDYTVYPNPTQNGTIQIRTSTKITEVNIFDALGRKVHQIMPEAATDHLTVNDLKKGIYFIQINGLNNMKAIEKIIVN
jgi:endonuclease I